MEITVTPSYGDSVEEVIRGAILVAGRTDLPVVFTMPPMVAAVVTGKDTLDTVLQRAAPVPRAAGSPGDDTPEGIARRVLTLEIKVEMQERQLSDLAYAMTKGGDV